MLRTYKNDIYDLIYRKLIIFIHFMMSKLISQKFIIGKLLPILI